MKHWRTHMKHEVISIVFVVGAHEDKGHYWVWAIPGESNPMSLDTPLPEEHPDAVLLFHSRDIHLANEIFSSLQTLMEKLGVRVVEGHLCND